MTHGNSTTIRLDAAPVVPQSSSQNVSSDQLLLLLLLLLQLCKAPLAML
jgi:hypothetical protein